MLKSGVPNAITVFRELREKGYTPRGIRLDSGDLTYLSREARRMLDEAGFTDAIICASGDLDEYLIRELKQQGACVDLWGVGTRMITSYDHPALGGVYKMSAEIVDGRVSNKIKISENRAKITDPGIKKLLRIYDENHMAVADLIALEEEKFDPSQPLTIFDPVDTWKKLTLTGYSIREMHVPLFRGGKRVYTSPSLAEISAYRQREMNSFWDHYKLLLQPRHYKVDLSPRLWTLRHEMLEREY